MTEVQLRTAIEETLGSVPFPASTWLSPGVRVAYCTAVRDALRPRLPSAVLEVYCRGGVLGPHEIVAEARAGTTQYRMVVPLVSREPRRSGSLG